VEQFQVDLGNGDVGTVYKDDTSGDAHMVQFDSVNNGVMSGSISQIDPQTGQMGEAMPFQAVHDSIPGASSVNSGSVPVADSEGGVYHMATEASTSFFAPGQSSTMQGGGASAAASPSSGTVEPGVSVPGPSTDGDSGMVGGGGSTRGSGAGRSTVQGFTPSDPSVGSFGGADGAPSETPPVDGGISSPPASSGGSFVPNGEDARGESTDSAPSSEAPPASPSIGGGFVPNEGGVGTRGGGDGRSSFVGTTSAAPSSESPAIDAGMSGASASVNEVSRFSRFSRHNPDNVEVFRRDNSNVQSYNKYTPDTVPLDDLDN
jgi:hypothetical protein